MADRNVSPVKIMVKIVDKKERVLGFRCRWRNIKYLQHCHGDYPYLCEVFDIRPDGFLSEHGDDLVTWLTGAFETELEASLNAPNPPDFHSWRHCAFTIIRRWWRFGGSTLYFQVEPRRMYVKSYEKK